MNARSLAITRAVAVIGGTGALIVGATLAATTTNPVTAAGTVNVSDNLTISQNNSAFSNSATGFVFNSAPASPSSSITPTDVWLQTTEPVNTVVLSARITAWDSNISTNASHLTLNFKLGTNTQSVPFSTLGSSDTGLTGLGPLTSTGSSSNDLKVWVTSDATTPVINSANGFTLQLTGTSDGNL